MKPTLVISNAKVICSALDLDGTKLCNVAIEGETIAGVQVVSEIGGGTNFTTLTKEIVDAEQAYLCAGLIDMHVHVLPYCNIFGLQGDLEEFFFSRGVTAVGDAGTAPHQGLRDLLSIAELSKLRIYIWINISMYGLVGSQPNHLQHPDNREPWMDSPSRVARMIEELRHNGCLRLLGLKVRNGFENTLRDTVEPIRAAKTAARLAGGVPVMVHHTHGPDIRLVLDELGEGDWLTHVLHNRDIGHGSTMLDVSGNVHELLLAKQRDGLVTDVGHGQGSFSWEVAEAAVRDQGFRPTTFSSDQHEGCRTSTDLLDVGEKFLYLGYDFARFIDGCTRVPAQRLGLDEIGTLETGRIADLALFGLSDEAVVLRDTHEIVRSGSTRIKCLRTFRAGEQVYAIS